MGVLGFGLGPIEPSTVVQMTTPITVQVEATTEAITASIETGVEVSAEVVTSTTSIVCVVEEV